MAAPTNPLSFPSASPGTDSPSVLLQKGIRYIGHMDTDGPSVWEMICYAFGIDPADENAFTQVLSHVQTGDQVAKAIQNAVSQPWQPWTPNVLVGDQNAQITSGETGGYRVIGSNCTFWLTVSFIFPNASGPIRITGVPEIAVGGVRFGLTIANATGFASGALPLTAVLQGQEITFYRGQNTMDPDALITTDDMENAASVTLQGSFQIEDV